MTDPHSSAPLHSRDDGPEKRPAQPEEPPRREGSDPHSLPDNHTPFYKPASDGGCGCEKEGSRSDPHGIPEDYTPPYEAKVSGNALLPPGVFRCTEADFAKICLAVAEVISAESLSAGNTDGIVKLSVCLGDRRKTVCVDLGKESRPDGLNGKMIVVVDNLEPRRFGTELSYGTALTAKDRDGRPVLIEVGGKGILESGGQLM